MSNRGRNQRRPIPQLPNIPRRTKPVEKNTVENKSVDSLEGEQRDKSKELNLEIDSLDKESNSNGKVKSPRDTTPIIIDGKVVDKEQLLASSLSTARLEGSEIITPSSPNISVLSPKIRRSSPITSSKIRSPRGEKDSKSEGKSNSKMFLDEAPPDNPPIDNPRISSRKNSIRVESSHSSPKQIPEQVSGQVSGQVPRQVSGQIPRSNYQKRQQSSRIPIKLPSEIIRQITEEIRANVLSPQKNKSEQKEKVKTPAAEKVEEKKEEIDYASLTDLERATLSAQYDIKFGIIRDSYRELKIPEIPVDEELEIKVLKYNTYFKYTQISDSTRRYRLWMVIFWLGMELFMIKTLGMIAARGYALTQLNEYNEYERMMFELGEKNYSGLGSTWPVELRLIVTSGINCVLFIIMKYLIEYTGPEIGKSIMNKLSSELKGNNATDTANTIASVADMFMGNMIPPTAKATAGEERRRKPVYQE